MMCGRMMLGEIVGQIREAGSPVNNKLILLDAVFNPAETHVNGFRTSLLDVFVGNTGGTGVVGLDRRRRLNVAKFVERDPESGSVLGVVEEGTKFSFGGRQENNGHDGAMRVNGAIIGRVRIGRSGSSIGISGLTAEEKMTCCTRMCF
jgi:hypothetical protein